MKREKWGILAAFLGGILLANLLGRELLVTYGILNEYHLSRYSYQKVDESRLLCHVLLERGKAAFVLFLLGHSLPGKVFAGLIRGGAVAGFGFLMAVAIVNLGARGIAVCLAGLLPQWIFYLAAIFVYTGAKEQGISSWRAGQSAGSIRTHIAGGICAALLAVLGFLSESYINPVLFGYILKSF